MGIISLKYNASHMWIIDGNTPVVIPPRFQGGGIQKGPFENKVPPEKAVDFHIPNHFKIIYLLTW